MGDEGKGDEGKGDEGRNKIQQDTGLGQTKVSIVKPADSMEQRDLRLS